MNLSLLPSGASVESIVPEEDDDDAKDSDVVLIDANHWCAPATGDLYVYAL